jgi:putative membrane-bound dehydrogenase-like protein
VAYEDRSMKYVAQSPWFAIAILLISLSSTASLSWGQFTDAAADGSLLPSVPEGFEVTLVASEPLVRQPCSMAFDRRGRLFIGMGPQYRNPTPETDGDRVVLMLDEDRDGKADRIHAFGEGLNAIQGLLWVGDDLWVANAPDLTILRDLDGDDVADRYTRLYTDLGNLEHGLHGLQMGPDGRVYMSKGNSKGLTQPGRVAPKAFRELWGVDAPDGTPDIPDPEVFTRETYRRNYHDPADDWGLDGGILRCQPDGSQLEVVCRGFRNPWDIAFDSGFHGIGTDNDQTEGDRVFSILPGGHFGWNHPWSSHWSDSLHPPTAPVSGPLFEGSGTGVAFYDADQFPDAYRRVFFVNDWLSKTTYLWRPDWDGALMRPAESGWQPFVVGGQSLFRPTDLEVGPDGALWILGWSRGYGVEWDDQGQMTNEGRIYRVAAKTTPSDYAADTQRIESERPVERWTLENCIAEFRSPLLVRRRDAQLALLQIGSSVIEPAIGLLQAGNLDECQETWLVWTLGQLELQDRRIDQVILDWATGNRPRPQLQNLQVQSIRILADRWLRRSQLVGKSEPPLPDALMQLLTSDQPRVRLEVVQAMRLCHQRQSVEKLKQAIAEERDPTVAYLQWQTLRSLLPESDLRSLLADPSPSLQQGALLALLETQSLSELEVQQVRDQRAGPTREIAQQWLDQLQGDTQPMIRGAAIASKKKGGGIDPVVGSASEPPAAAAVTGIASGRSVKIVPQGLVPGALVYSDRSYTIQKVPESLLGADLVQTPNDDDGSTGVDYLRLELHMPSQVTIAVDRRNASRPDWLLHGFEKSTESIEADHWAFDLYSRKWDAGSIQLGGNTQDGKAGGKGNYIVLIQPQVLAPQPSPATLDQTLEQITQGNAARGKALFLHPKGAGCGQCHRLQRNQKAAGPYLGDIARRSQLHHLVQSIIDPNAVITEGFQLQVIATEEGEVHSGVLVEESGLKVSLGLSNGSIIQIPKGSIQQRSQQARSAMPDFSKQLTIQHVTDLVAFLQTLREEREGSGPGIATGQRVVFPAGGTQEVKAQQVGSYRIERSDRVWRLHSGDREIGQFVLESSEIPRPHFANLSTPNGTQVTRNHPPVPGVDADDHATMHPGVWMAFGDLSGEDFWRNRARMRHEKVTEEPHEEDGVLRWGMQSSLIGKEGGSIGTVLHRIAIKEVPSAWAIEWEAAFQASEGRELVFGDQEEMGFGVRVATPITEKNGGRLVNSEGDQTASGTWGKAASWVDYSGAIEGKKVGVTVAAHRFNFRPSWWHNRDYGVFVANPFGRSAMKQGEVSAVRVAAGESLTLRFLTMLHEGDDYQPETAIGKVWK